MALSLVAVGKGKEEMPNVSFMNKVCPVSLCFPSTRGSCWPSSRITYDRSISARYLNKSIYSTGKPFHLFCEKYELFERKKDKRDTLCSKRTWLKVFLFFLRIHSTSQRLFFLVLKVWAEEGNGSKSLHTSTIVLIQSKLSSESIQRCHAEQEWLSFQPWDISNGVKANLVRPGKKGIYESYLLSSELALGK